MKIAISGKSGCGNTTVSGAVAEALGLELINFTFRSLAVERGVDLAEILRRAALDDAIDREVDTRQTALARASAGCVMGSRLAIWMLTDADLKVYLRAREETRVRRILEREGGDYTALAAFTASRDAQDHARYLRIYGIDNDDTSAADVVLDTDECSVAEVAARIVAEANSAAMASGRQALPS